MEISLHLFKWIEVIEASNRIFGVLRHVLESEHNENGSFNYQYERTNISFCYLSAESGEFEETAGSETENQNDEKEIQEETEDASSAERKVTRENSGAEAGEMSDDRDTASANKETCEEPAVSLPSSIQKMPRPLHKTHSIFLRNLHPSITRQVSTICTIYCFFLY